MFFTLFNICVFNALNVLIFTFYLIQLLLYCISWLFFFDTLFDCLKFLFNRLKFYFSFLTFLYWVFYNLARQKLHCISVFVEHVLCVLCKGDFLLFYLLFYIFVQFWKHRCKDLLLYLIIYVLLHELNEFFLYQWVNLILYTCIDLIMHIFFYLQFHIILHKLNLLLYLLVLLFKGFRILDLLGLF